MLYKANQKGPFKVPGFHDPDSVRLIGMIFKPESWEAGRVYNFIDKNFYDIVIPTTFKGFYYKCINSGISNATTEPTWNRVSGGETEDFETGETEGLMWQSVPYNLLPINESVDTIVYSATNGVTISNESNTANKCTFLIDAIDINATARTLKKFQISLRVNKLSDKPGQKFDVTLEFTLGEH